MLDVLNHRLGADFDRADFEHVAVWDAGAGVDRDAPAGAAGRGASQLPDLDLRVAFDAGEEIRTEISAKFRRDGLTAELTAAGFVDRGWWTDEREWFSLSLWAPA